MERILGILTRSATARAVLATCGHLLKLLPDSRLSLLHPRPDIDPSFMPTEEIMTDDRRRSFDSERDRIFAALQRELAAWSPPGPSPRVPLRQAVGKPATIIVAEAAQSDLIVLGAAGQEHDPEAKAAIDVVLFDAAASALLVPGHVPDSLGRHIAIAWKPSRAADEAVLAALPILLKAEAVTFLICEDGQSPDATPAGIMQALEEQARPAGVRRFSLSARAIGEALLAEAHGIGADLLVMGAFTHNRTMEAIFGGATREVLAGADIPVLMHH